MLQKGRFLLTLTILTCAALIFSTAVDSLAAQKRPVRQGISDVPAKYTSLGHALPSGRRYIGTERPDWLFTRMGQVQAAQNGSGPRPDMNITETATASEELHADAAPQGELNRIVISSNGVDEDGDGQFDPGVTADNYNLWLVRVDGSFATQLTDMEGDELYPAYDPGGRLIAFSNNSSGTWQLYTVEVLTGTVRQVTSSSGNKYDPTWSTDGLRMVFSGDANGNRDLFIIPADGSSLPQAIMETPEDETQPDWSPSAAVVAGQILFTQSGGATGSRIWRVDPDGNNLEMVTEGGGDPLSNDTDPTWRHNSQLIAFSSDRPTDGTDLERDYNIWTVPPSGESVVEPRLRSNLDEEDTHDDRFPAFSPGLDPRQPIRIFFTSDRPDDAGAEPDIWRFELTDPVPPELGDLPWVDAERRYVTPGNDVTVHVEVFDRDSGVESVIAEFKDPDSAEDDSQGIDHKIFGFAPGMTWAVDPVDGTGAIELDCDTVGQTELFDDGNFEENGDEVAGDGIFSGKWTTPGSPSDYIIDIWVQDVAGNSFEYDDIYGFTTLQFQPSTSVLLVNDYCEGQGFIWNASLENNDWPVQFPVESYYTTNPGDSEEAENEAYNTFIDGVSGRNGGRGIWPPQYLGEDYDIWRVICRGRITMSDLIYYLPTNETQLTVPDMEGTRDVLVASRAVVWAAPHTGNMWVAEGTISDAATQSTLMTFLDRGGRMMISGQDIGFALTLDGTQPNTFYNTYLHADYVRDVVTPSGTICYPQVGGTRLPGAWWPDDIDGVEGDPVARHPGWTFYPSTPNIPYDIRLGADHISNACRGQDAAQYTVWPDQIEATGGATVTHTYNGGYTAGIRYEEPGGGYRTVYFAWGFEQTHRNYDELSDSEQGYGVCMNNRSKLMHNVLCHLRTAGFQGRVVSVTDGNQPINDPTPIVQLFTDSNHENMVAAVRCEEDGRYVIGGLAPDVYYMRAVRAGFEIDHADSENAHGGGNYPVVDFAIVRAAPGAVRGTVTSQATGEELAAVEVCAYLAVLPEDDPEEDGDTDDGGTDDGDTQPAQNGDEQEYELGELIGCTTTAADGTYQIGDVPAGDVVVVADGGDIGYGTEEALIEVLSGNTAEVDLALTAAPGEIVVTAEDEDGVALEDATVDVLSGGALIDSATTDAGGEAVIEVQPGSYSVEASRPGFEPSEPVAVDVDATETVEVTVTLQSEDPGSVSGLIARGVTGEPAEGMTVELVVNDEVRATTVTFADPLVADDGARYNYRFEDAPTGEIVVRPDPTGFTVTPAQRTVTVETDEETTGVNFEVSSIRQFPAGLQLMSLPYDYPAADPAELLGANPADFDMAAWEPQTGQYSLYPSAPADRFRLGSGYWIKLDEVRELTREGILADDEFELSLQAGESGWNLVGNFFLEPLDFYSLSVRDRNGVERTMQQALASGLVRSPLFAYQLGGYATSAVAEAYVGYWLNVGADVTIIGNRETDTLAVGEESTASAIAPPEGGWLMPVVVTSGEMQDAATWIGCAPEATDGFDSGLDMLKPPPADMASMVYAASAGDLGAQAVDVRASEAPEWTMDVQGPAGERVTVRWPDMSSLPADVRPFLVDTAADRQVYMRTTNSYEFTAREGVRQLQIRLSGAGGALAVSVPAARDTGAGAEISYTLSADAQVDVQVLNIAGRTVDSVVESDLQTAGTQRVTWDGLSTRGTRAPNGTYLVVVRARAADGQQTQAIGTVSVGR